MTHPLIQSKLDLRQHLLANFYDGDSWEAADATSLTKHGALHVAEYFFLLGVEMAEGCLPSSGSNVFRYCCEYHRETENWNTGRDKTLAAIKELKEGLGKESV